MKVIHLLRKPTSEGTVAANVLRHGTGALNVDGCRIGYASEKDRPTQKEWNVKGSTGKVGANGFAGQFGQSQKNAYAMGLIPVSTGRWPANVLLTEGPAVDSFAAFGEKSSGVMVGHYQGWGTQGVYGSSGLTPATCYADNGSAARYFQAVKQTNQVGEP
jgi:site-specific DNA-methyltransferase (adenine-specific)